MKLPKPESAVKDIAMLLHETAALMRRRFEAAARPEGLTLMQWRALALLDRDGPLRQRAVGEALEASPMTISDLAERMAVAGLVRRAQDPDDSRAKTLELTDDGRAKLEAMRRVSDRVFADVFGGVDAREAEALRRGLVRIKQNLGAA